MKTSSSTRSPSQSWTPHLTVTRSPMTTSFSTNTWSQMLASRPMRAPGSTCANAQTRLPSPIASVSQMPAGWTNAPTLVDGPAACSAMGRATVAPASDGGGGGADGVDDGLLLLVGEMGADRQAEVRARELLGDGERALAPPQAGVGVRAVRRHGIEDQRPDATLLQRPLQRVAARVLDGEDVPDGVRPLRDGGQPQSWDVRERLGVAAGDLRAARVPVVE